MMYFIERERGGGGMVIKKKWSHKKMSKQDFIKEYKFWKSLQGQKFPPKLTKLIKTNSIYILREFRKLVMTLKNVKNTPNLIR